ncbi:MAG TPA: hypothetical protein VI318_08875 [Baekduia sp.]
MSAAAVASFGLAAASVPAASPDPPAAPLAVTTGDATDVTLSSARVTGSVNPRGAAATAHFEYGVNAAYGRRTGDVRIGVATRERRFAARLTALVERNAVHYRAVVATSFGTFYGPDRVFVTGARPGGSGGGGDDPPPPAKRHHRHQI